MKKNITIKEFYGANVWSYTRVSTKEQFLNNGSIENQVSKIKAFAKEHNLTITEEFDAEYESSKRINTQVTLKELTDKLKKTPAHKRPKIILIWSPSRFGRAGAEHIGLFVNLRKSYNVFLYSISTDHNTFNERSENEFSSQLLYAQKENFNRQDTIIPGMISSLQNGKVLGKAPIGYDHYGPKVKDPEKLKAVQEIKVNAVGELIREAFQMKLYQNYNDNQIRLWFKSKGVNIPRNTLSRIWRNPFYTGKLINKLLEGTEVDAPWESLISVHEFEQLQRILSGKVCSGVPKITGKKETPLSPQFLICSSCESPMTSYHNKKRKLYYYKCNSCFKAINADSSKYNIGVHDQFSEVLKEFEISEKLGRLVVAQTKKMMSNDISNNSERKRILSTAINKLKNDLENMEYRYAIGQLSKEIYERQSDRIKKEVAEKQKELNRVPGKISNIDKVLKLFTKIAQNPYEFYDSLNYPEKRRFQSILFPKGIYYSIEKREYLTSETNILFDLTRSISASYKNEKSGSKSKKVDSSHLVPGVGIEPTLLRTRV